MAFSPGGFRYGSCPEGLDIFRVVLPPSISSKELLFDALESLLVLPGYFGRNWDALADLLSDLGWLSVREVAIEHTDLPDIGEESLKQYLQVLGESVSSWACPEAGHSLRVYFAESDRVRVQQLYGPLGT